LPQDAEQLAPVPPSPDSDATDQLFAVYSSVSPCVTHVCSFNLSHVVPPSPPPLIHSALNQLRQKSSC
jgi:hypothetical protein